MLAFSGTAVAQVYSWTEAGSGQKRLSSVPPPWYSTGRSPGPRTVVTLGPFLIDDTGQAPAQRALLQEKGKALLAQKKEEDAPESEEPAAVEPVPVPQPAAVSRGSRPAKP